MAVNSADPSRATVTAVAGLVLDATTEEVAEVVTEETLDETVGVVAEETLDEGEDVVDDEPSDEADDVVEDWTEADPDRSVEVPDCAVARPMRPTTPMMNERMSSVRAKELQPRATCKLSWA
jgi:hypothetical protein